MDEIISGRALCGLLIDVLRLMDQRLLNHSVRVSYLLYRMLDCKGGYWEQQLAEYALIGVLHDIGAFKVNPGEDLLSVEMEKPMPHSLYGCYFLKDFSPIGDRARILMYSHIEYRQLKGLDFPEKDIANYINLAGRYALFRKVLGQKFDVDRLMIYRDTKFSAEALSLLDAAVRKYHIPEKFEGDACEKELDKLFGRLTLSLSEEEKEKYLQMLLYITGFRDEYNVIDTVTATAIAVEIAKKLGGFTGDEMEALYYGSLLHDIGMLTVPVELVNGSGTRTNQEMVTLLRHVEEMEKLLKGRVRPDVLVVALAHHERLDGSGYPRRLTEKELNMPQMILQVADAVTELTCRRPNRKPRTREGVAAALSAEMHRNRLHPRVVTVFLDHYDEIMKTVNSQSEEVLTAFWKLQEQYENVIGTLENAK